MSQWHKLFDKILSINVNLRFHELAKVLTHMGYIQHQPKGGSSHFTFRKDGKMPITIPKITPIKKAYVKLVRDAILDHENEEA